MCACVWVFVYQEHAQRQLLIDENALKKISYYNLNK